MRAWGAPVAAGLVHLLVVGAGLLVLGHPLPDPGAVLGPLVLGAATARWWSQDRLRSPLVLAALGLLAAVVLELVTPGPWVTELGSDRLTVGTPVLWSYAGASPLWTAVCGLAGLGEAALRRADRPGWARAAGSAVLVTVLWLGAVLLTGLSRGWAASPPPYLAYGLVPAGVLVLGATLLVHRVRLVTPWLVLLVVTGVAGVACWVQAPAGGSVAAAGLLAGSTVSLVATVLLGLVESTVRGLTRLTGRRRSAAPATPDQRVIAP